MRRSQKKVFLAGLAVSICCVSTVLGKLVPGGSTTVQLDSGGTAVVNLSGLKYNAQYTFAATDACCGGSNTVAALDVRVDCEQNVSGGMTATINDYPLAEGEMEDDQIFRTYVDAWPASFGCGTLTVKAARLLISGDPFDQITISSSIGITRPLAPVGSQGNPAHFSSANTLQGSFQETGTNYWFLGSFTAGQWYRLTCSQKTTFVLAEGVATNFSFGDTTLLFRALRTGTFTNCVWQTPEIGASTFTLGLEYPPLSDPDLGTPRPERLPAEHTSFATMSDEGFGLTDELLLEGFPVEANQMPSGIWYVDTVIDSGLLRFNSMMNRGQYTFTCQVAAHTNWQETVGGGTNVQLITHSVPYDPFPIAINVYDMKGANCWATNLVVADHDVVGFTFSPTNSGDYWIGFCQTNAKMRLVYPQNDFVLKGIYSNVTCDVTVRRSVPTNGLADTAEISFVYDVADGVYGAGVGNKGLVVKGGTLGIGDDGGYQVTASSLNRLEIRVSALAGTGPYVLVSGKWPSGLTFDAQTGLLTGIATVPGSYHVVVEASDGARVSLSLEVTDGAVMLGRYSGVVSGRALTADQWAAPVMADGEPQFDYAAVALTVGASGKLSAKAIVGGKAYSFAATGFMYDAKEAQTYALFKKAVKVSGTGCEDELRIRMPVSGSFGGVVEALRVHFAHDNGKSALEGRYATDSECMSLAGGQTGSKPDTPLVRQQSLGTLMPSYYTMALMCTEDALAKRGAGWLTMRVTAKGGVTVLGAFPNGKRVSASAWADVRSDDPDNQSICVPLCLSSRTDVLAGVVRLAPDTQSGVWVADGVFRWNSVAPADVLTGDSRMEILRPIGGAYATDANVQTVLQADTLEAHVEEEGLFAFGLPSGATGISFPETFQVDVGKAGLSTSAKRLVKDADNNNLIDWERSGNPFGFKVRLMSATGVLSGSVDVWYWDAGAAKEKNRLAKLTGVLLQTHRSDELWSLAGVGTVGLPASKNAPLPTGLLILQ